MHPPLSFATSALITNIARGGQFWVSTGSQFSVVIPSDFSKLCLPRLPSLPS